ncbi:MAG: Mur ligase family protein [Pseudomonadota bacterium]
MPLSDLLVQARQQAQAHAKPLSAPYPTYTIFLSISDGEQRARVVHASHTTFESAWKTAAARCQRLVQRQGLEVRWLRVDWPTSTSRRTWKTLKAILKNTKRNYFRFGLALDTELKHAFLEQELNANAMLYGGNQITHAVINEKNFQRYAGQRFHGLDVDFTDDREVIQLSTTGLFCAAGESPLALHGAGRNAGRRVISRLQADDVRRLIDNSSRYLSRQVQPSGRFHYGWHACFDRPIRAYNSLRHASTTYAMIEAWEVTGDRQLKAAIDRSLHYLTHQLIHDVTLPDGQQAAFLVDSGDEIKLGGNAVCLLALVQYSQATGSRHYLSLLERLALGIHHMQEPDSGRFVHVLNYPDLSLKEAFRIIYYDGEAAFGLMRLHGLTGDPRWLQMVEHAFEHFIAAEHWKAHDHWLSYCVNELTHYRDDERYYRFGLQNVTDYLGFVASRITTFPTLLELMMAADAMVRRLQASPEHAHLLESLDLTRFYQALEFRAHYLLNGHFFPEVAMYFQNPQRILGSFHIRHHAFRVRIDDVEHYLSGYVAYLGYLQHGGQPGALPTRPDSRPHVAPPADTSCRHGPNWSQDRLEAATPGRWEIAPPSKEWRATGLAFTPETLPPGGIAALRPRGGSRGIHPDRILQLPFTPQALLVQEGEPSPALRLPTYRVADFRQAILDMGTFARSRMPGQVIGVTGSAGKTTVIAMLKHLLRLWGRVGSSAHNANLPMGIAWNLASMPWSADFQVVEMAIGRMAHNSRLARPHIALFLNVAPAHLAHHHTTEEIARRKSRIFLHMKAGQPAIINRDLREWPIIAAAAEAQGLRIISFGRHPDSSVRLLEARHQPHGVQVEVACQGKRLARFLPVANDALVENALACLGVLLALELPLEPAQGPLSTFALPAGRGQSLPVRHAGKRVTLIDDAYNANPRSMQAFLQRLVHERGRLLLVLGDMLELGEASTRHHAELIPWITASGASSVFLLGDDMGRLAPHLLDAGIESHAAKDPLRLFRQLSDRLQDGDVVAVKGSHASRAFRIVEGLTADSPASRHAAPGYTSET